jgi:hypothetical protein
VFLNFLNAAVVLAKASAEVHPYYCLGNSCLRPSAVVLAKVLLLLLLLWLTSAVIASL